jgi:hypothetical protein
MLEGCGETTHRETNCRLYAAGLTPRTGICIAKLNRLTCKTAGIVAFACRHVLLFNMNLAGCYHDQVGTTLTHPVLFLLLLLLRVGPSKADASESKEQAAAAGAGSVGCGAESTATSARLPLTNGSSLWRGEEWRMRHKQLARAL